jgi:hypothetical protein
MKVPNQLSDVLRRNMAVRKPFLVVGAVVLLGVVVAGNVQPWCEVLTRHFAPRTWEGNREIDANGKVHRVRLTGKTGAGNGLDGQIVALGMSPEELITAIGPPDDVIVCANNLKSGRRIFTYSIDGVYYDLYFVRHGLDGETLDDIILNPGW